MSNKPITASQRRLAEQAAAIRKDDEGFLNALASFIARRSCDTAETNEIFHVHTALDGKVREVEDLYTVIEDLRDDLKALRDAFEEHRTELRETQKEQSK